MRRAHIHLLLAVTTTILIASVATALSRQTPGPSYGLTLRYTAGMRSLALDPEEPAVLVRMYSGRVLPTTQEISVTEIFREPTFTVLADPAISQASEAELMAHAREIFSLAELSSLGSSIVSLTGGSAILNDGSRNLEIEIHGQYVSDDTVRLIVSRKRDGEEVVATSVVARRGKTVILVGTPAPDGGDLPLICLTPL